MLNTTKNIITYQHFKEVLYKVIAMCLPSSYYIFFFFGFHQVGCSESLLFLHVHCLSNIYGLHVSARFSSKIITQVPLNKTKHSFQTCMASVLVQFN